MPGTGNNRRFSEKILSIRLSPDGLSFWTEDSVDPAQWNTPAMKILSPAAGKERQLFFGSTHERDGGLNAAIGGISEAIGGALPQKKVVYIDTLKTVLIPAEIYVEGSGADYLELNNIAPQNSEQTDVSQPICDTISVMAVPREAMELLGMALGEFMILSPSQYNLVRIPGGIKCIRNKSGKEVRVYATSGLAHISVLDVAYSSGVKQLYSDVIVAASPADILYHLSAIDPYLTVRKSPVLVKGTESDNITAILRKRFKKTQCG